MISFQPTKRKKECRIETASNNSPLPTSNEGRVCECVCVCYYIHIYIRSTELAFLEVIILRTCFGHTWYVRLAFLASRSWLEWQLFRTSSLRLSLQSMMAASNDERNLFIGFSFIRCIKNLFSLLNIVSALPSWFVSLTEGGRKNVEDLIWVRTICFQAQKFETPTTENSVFPKKHITVKPIRWRLRIIFSRAETNLRITHK